MQLTEQGEVVYKRTYSRTKPDGTKETWPDTVRRVVDGNLALVDSKYHLPYERDELIRMMEEFKIIPAGRHLWMTGVPGRQYLFNCHVAGWHPDDIVEHFTFTFLRLAEGGGVGSNYSNHFLDRYPVIRGFNSADDPTFHVHIVCDPSHPDYDKLKDHGLLSQEYASEWSGAYQVEDTREGWAAAFRDLMETYYRPAKNQRRVFDVSRVRWQGARLMSSGGHASGPVPLAMLLLEVAEIMNSRIGHKLDGLSAMAIDHAIAKAVVAGGNRRSARMAQMHWSDDQIFEFIKAKQNPDPRSRDWSKTNPDGSPIPWADKPSEYPHWTTNISVEIDDDFIDIVRLEAASSRDYITHRVLEEIAAGMLTNGEPGFWNSSLSNFGEPNRVIATNPCGEIALEPWENCNLGHINLAAFVDPKTGQVDHWDLKLAHRLMTRFLMRATYGDVRDDKQRMVLDRNRRVGVGHLGVASYLALTGVKYSEAPENLRFISLLRELAKSVDSEAARYARELRIPVPVKTRTVAPTGTISKLVGVSEGIHPIMHKYFVRRIRFSANNPEEMKTVERYREMGYHVEPDLYSANTWVVSLPTKDVLLDQVAAIHGADKADELVQAAPDLTMTQMLAFQAMYQEVWADNAVSFTVNFHRDEYTVHDMVEVLTEFMPLLKGATVFPFSSMEQAPYEPITAEEYALYEDWLKTTADSTDENCATGACPVR